MGIETLIGWVFSCDQAALRTFLSICMFVHTGQKSDDFKQIWAFLDYNTSLNSQMATKWCKKLGMAYKTWSFIFQGHLSNFKVTVAAKLMIWLWFEHYGWQLEFEFMDCYNTTHIAFRKEHGRASLLFPEVISQILRSHWVKNQFVHDLK